ncbi:M23 family metallopeptidase, partial [Bradyrhizobium canariense]|uniref:M23 family metallopeptidase n=1 Tax=Bradyrhizobium canariense TaxID=255045 RepID=UPI001F0B34DA
KGMEPGKKVRQGQVIGFVGSTGASTGPHVHYEILVNGRFVDPRPGKPPPRRPLRPRRRLPCRRPIPSARRPRSSPRRS